MGDLMYMNQELIYNALLWGGEREVPGKGSNPRLIELFERWGYKGYDDSDLAWCSIMMNEWAEVTGLEKSGKANAKSWLDFGREIHPTDVLPGDVLIFHRGDPSSWKGHVGINLFEDITTYAVWGGNQGNKVGLSHYEKSRLAGIRRLRIKEFISYI